MILFYIFKDYSSFYSIYYMILCFIMKEMKKLMSIIIFYDQDCRYF